MTVLHGISREINELNQRPEIQREMMKMFEKMPKMNDFIEKKWTDTDLCEFSEWLGINDWGWSHPTVMWRRVNRVNGYAEQKTTSQLRKQWEIETGRRVK